MKQFSDFVIAHNSNDMEQYLHQGWEVQHIYYEPSETTVESSERSIVVNKTNYGSWNENEVPSKSIISKVIINYPKFIMARKPAVKVLYENDRTDPSSN